MLKQKLDCEIQMIGNWNTAAVGSQKPPRVRTLNENAER
jgi:hypothetical protein